MHRNPTTSQLQNTPVGDGMKTRQRLRRGLLYLARALWIIFALCNLISLPFGIQAFYTQTLATGRSVPNVARALNQLHLSAAQLAISLTVIFVLASVVFLVIGMLIFWRLWGTSNELLGLLISFIFVTTALTGITGVFAGVSVSPNPFLQMVFYISGISFFVLFPCLAAFLLTFPNGRFAPRWSWLIILLWIVQFGFFILTSVGLFPVKLLYLLVVPLTWGSTLGIQVYRYMRVYSYSERQQTKWLVFGVTSGLILFTGSTLIGNLLPELSRLDSPYQLLVNNLGGLVVFLPIALSVGIALLRYRLWNIDILINRTLVYGTLTVMLALVYFGLIIGLQSLVHLVTGTISEQPLVIVASTLAIFALFLPLRRRIQAIIDRRFYRRKYDSAKIVAAFSATLRNEVDLSQLSENLLAVVQETMQPAHISLWLRKPQQVEKHNPWVPNTMEEGF